MNNYIIKLIIISLLPISVYGQKPVLYIGATAHLGNGEKIENSAISVLNGRFELVANASTIRINPASFDTIIRLYGKKIYPGFILPNTTLGITEIDAVRATNDYLEVGDFNPNVRSLIAYNTDSRITKTVRTNGILIAQTTPRGGLVSGQSSVLYLDGGNWEDAICRKDDGIHINWPSSLHAYENDENQTEYENRIQRLIDFLEKAHSYAKYHSVKDLRMESMLGLFQGTKTLYIHANIARDIRKSITVSKKFNIKNCVIVGGEEAILVEKDLKELNVPVILNRLHRLPKSQDIDIEDPFRQPKKLKELGVLFCFSYEGDMEAMGARNLSFTAGTAVAYGLSYEDAISALTLNTAKILGIDDRLGSIETGKEATFFISSGDALDMRTNNVEQAFINGVSVDLDNHQSSLFEKYK